MTRAFRPFYNTREKTDEGFTQDQLCRNDLDAGRRGESMQQLYEEKKNMQRKQEVENSEVHLLPVFVLPPRGGEDEKNGRGKKGERLMPITTNIWKKSDRKG